MVRASVGTNAWCSPLLMYPYTVLELVWFCSWIVSVPDAIVARSCVCNDSCTASLRVAGAFCDFCPFASCCPAVCAESSLLLALRLKRLLMLSQKEAMLDTKPKAALMPDDGIEKASVVGIGR